MQPNDSFHLVGDFSGDRDTLRTLIFGMSTLPTTLPTVTASASPVPGLAACSRLSLTGLADCYLWAPSGATELVVIHQGHMPSLTDIGIGELIKDFHRNGYAVLGCLMPDAGSIAAHNSGQRPYSDFLLPMIAGLNYAESLGFTEAAATGISGGNWTLQMVAAIDERVTKTIPVAGCLPHYYGLTSELDWEQTLSEIAPYSYVDLHALCTTNGRSQLVIMFDGDGSRKSLAFFSAAPDFRPLLQSVAQGPWSMEWINQTQHAITMHARRRIFEWLTGKPFPYAQIKDAVAANVVGAWTLFSSPPPNTWVGNNCYSRDVGTAADYVQWTFAVAPGIYDVWASCSAHSGRSSNAPYLLFDGATQVGGVVRIDQRPQPTDYVDASGVGFNHIGAIDVTTGTLAVRVRADADAKTMADAARVMRRA